MVYLPLYVANNTVLEVLTIEVLIIMHLQTKMFLRAL